ncbi:MAG: lysoplasmalogenase [Flavobacteriales bacterium]|nr:lysoplasmalogenase [Flavobacteriales bacterium]
MATPIRCTARMTIASIRKDPIVNLTAYMLATIGAIMGMMKDWYGLMYVAKPSMMVILSIWFFYNSRRYGDRFTLLVQAGLFFSWIGDIALMFQQVDEFNFLIGLAAFLLAQICYAMAFAQNAIDVGNVEGIWVSILLAVGIAAYGFFFSIDLVKYLDSALLVPVIGYVVAITAMGIAAGFRFRRTFPRSFWMVMIGALLFIASDSILARNRFVRPVAMADLWTMLTYASAQWLIAAGCLEHVLDPEEIRRRQAIKA